MVIWKVKRTQVYEWYVEADNKMDAINITLEYGDSQASLTHSSKESAKICSLVYPVTKCVNE